MTILTPTKVFVLIDDQAESLAQQLEANPNYRVLRKLVPLSAFAETDGKPLSIGVIVDTETTGLNQDSAIFKFCTD